MCKCWKGMYSDFRHSPDLCSVNSGHWFRIKLASVERASRVYFHFLGNWALSVNLGTFGRASQDIYLEVMDMLPMCICSWGSVGKLAKHPLGVREKGWKWLQMMNFSRHIWDPGLGASCRNDFPFLLVACQAPAEQDKGSSSVDWILCCFVPPCVQRAVSNHNNLTTHKPLRQTRRD